MQLFTIPPAARNSPLNCMESSRSIFCIILRANVQGRVIIIRNIPDMGVVDTVINIMINAAATASRYREAMMIAVLEVVFWSFIRFIRFFLDQGAAAQRRKNAAAVTVDESSQ
jgi:uncharacterized membrane protein YcaP (DUF421 family)